MTESKRSGQLGTAWRKLTGMQTSGSAFDGFLGALETRGEAPVDQDSPAVLSTWPFSLAGQIPYGCYFLLLHIIARPGSRIQIDAHGNPADSELDYFKHLGLDSVGVHAGVKRLRREGILSPHALGFEGIKECRWLRVRHPAESASN